MSTGGDIAKGLASNPIVGGVLVVGAIGAFVWWKWGDDIGKLFTEKFNPASDKNLAYSGVNSVGAAITGDEAWSLGGAIYDATHNEDGSFKNPVSDAISTIGDWFQFDERERNPGVVPRTRPPGR